MSFLANPRNHFPLANGPPPFSSRTAFSGQVVLAATNLRSGHDSVKQGGTGLASGNWSNAVNFVPARTVQSVTTAIGKTPYQSRRIFVP